MNELPVITYTDEWEFWWGEENPELGTRTLHSKITRQDSTNPEVMQYLDWNFEPPMPFDPKWLLHQLDVYEEHEVCEWFQIDGEAPYFPHMEWTQDQWESSNEDERRQLLFNRMWRQASTGSRQFLAKKAEEHNMSLVELVTRFPWYCDE